MVPDIPTPHPVLAMARLNVNRVLGQAGRRNTPATHGTAADVLNVDSDGLHGKFYAIADGLGAHRVDKTILVSPAVSPGVSGTTEDRNGIWHEGLHLSGPFHSEETPLN